MNNLNINNMKKLVTLTTLLVGTLAFSQFTTNTMLNTLVSSNDDVLLASKLFTTPTGKTIVGYVTDKSKSYKIQLINSDGTLGFSPSGVTLYTAATNFVNFKDFTDINFDTANNPVILNTSFGIDKTITLYLLEQNTGSVLNTVTCGTNDVATNCKLLNLGNNSFIVAFKNVISKYTIIKNHFVLDWTNTNTESNNLLDLQLVNSNQLYLIGEDYFKDGAYGPKVQLFDSSTGLPIWKKWATIATGCVFSTHFGELKSFVIGSELILFYADSYETGLSVYSQKIDLNGNWLYDEPVVLFNAPMHILSVYPILNYSDNTLFILAFDLHDKKIMAQEIDCKGRLLLHPSGLNQIENEISFLMDVKPCVDGTPILLYKDKDNFIKALKLSYKTPPFGSPNAILLNSTKNTKSVFDGSIAISEIGAITATFVEERNGKIGLYAQKANCLCQTLLNTTDEVQETFFLFPNPTSNDFTVKSSTTKEIKSITLFNTEGKKVITIDEIFQKEKTINCSGLPDGLYTVEITDITQKQYVLKLQKN